MQIKVTLEEQISFQMKWARALASAEEALSNTIIQNLRNFIEQIDKSIAEKNQTDSRNMKNQKEKIDPMQRIKVIFIDAYKERLKINSENNKRKRNNNEEDKDEDKVNKNKKFKKNKDNS